MRRPRERVLFLGGNGHAPWRLRAACSVLEREFGEVLALHDVPLAGFDGRSRASSFEDFLDQLEQQVARLGGELPGTTIYATGVGGLYALGLRARGRLASTPLILQGPVLWGLEQRRFPRIMRALPAGPQLLQRLFRVPAVQRRFARKHFERELEPTELNSFFEGYERATSFADMFDWLTPEWLRSMEQQLGEHPEALDGIEFWWGELDHVVGPDELERTERALGRSFPVRRFPGWGHYPMIDDPVGWARELARVVLRRQVSA